MGLRSFRRSSIALGRVVAEVARDCGYNEIKFLDDKSDIAIGKIVNLEKLKEEYTDVFCWYRT